MNIKEITGKYLKDNGYDGLCNPEGGCGCSLDDFMPCGEPHHEDCQAGYQHKDNLIYLKKEESRVVRND